MRFHVSTALQTCLGTCLAALLLGLQNIDEYTTDLLGQFPEQEQLVDSLRMVAEATGLPACYRVQKTILSDADLYLQRLTETPPPAPPSPTLPPAPTIVYVQIPEHRQLDTFRAPAPAPTSEPLYTPEQLIISHREQPAEEQPTPPAEPPTPEPEPPPAPTPEPAPAPEPPPPPTPEEIARQNREQPVHCRIMMLGDSLMEDFGPLMHRALRHRAGLYFILTAKYSTGLSRPDYFNWPQNMELAVEQTRPDIIIFFMGANDAMPIRSGGRALYPKYGEPWRNAYREKMDEMLDIAAQHGCDVIWIGLPPMGSRYADLLQQTTLAQREACETRGIPYIDTTRTIGDESGLFRSHMSEPDGRIVRLRAKDKEHLTDDGNRLVLQQLMPVLEEKIADFRQKHPEKSLTPDERSRENPARLEITIKYKPGKKK